MEIKGVICPIITPMNKDESINEAELRGHVDRLIKAGVHGIFVFGTTGEAYVLSESEKERILSVVVDEVGARVPVHAGTGCIATADTIRLSKKARALGADALSVITPYFAQASQDELCEHYTAVAKAVDLPIVLYNIPARTGNALAPESVERLSHIDNIVGVKDSSGNFQNQLAYIEATQGRDFAVLSGSDSLILWNLLAGGAGAVAGCSNVFPANVSGIYDAFVSGDLNKARVLQDSIRPFRELFRFGSTTTIIKAAVVRQGHPVGSCRKPFYKLSDQTLSAIKEVLEQSEKLGIR